MSNQKILELRQKRAALVQEGRKLITDAENSEAKAMTSDQEARYAKIMEEVDKLKETISREEKQIALEAEIAAAATAPDTRQALPGDEAKKQSEKEVEARAAFFKYLKEGKEGLTEKERRALQEGTDTLGGYMRTPQVLAQDILKAADAALKLRTLVTQIPIGNAESLGIVTLDTDMEDGDWTTELQTGNEGSMEYGKRELQPHPLAKRLKVSKKLLFSAFLNLEAHIVERLGRAIARAQENAYMTGDGAGKPLGMFVASADGIPTAQDVPMGAWSALDGDHLIDMQHKIREPYRPNAKWVMHSDIVKAVRKLKAAVSGDYLWQPGLKLGEPDTLLGRELVESEYAPNATTNGSYVMIYGDLTYYYVVDALNMMIQRLTELYAETNQEGYIVRYEGDGQPVLGEAFARSKVSA